MKSEGSRYVIGKYVSVGITFFRTVAFDGFSIRKSDAKPFQWKEGRYGSGRCNRQSIDWPNHRLDGGR